MTQDHQVITLRKRGRPLGRNGHLDEASLKAYDIAAKLVGLHAFVTDQHKAISQELHALVADLRAARTVHETSDALRKAA